MKNLKPHFAVLLIAFFMLSIGFTSCTVHEHHRKVVVVKEKRMPPGHAKKVYGDKSAKRYAPGQQKKNKKSKVIIIN
jgi:hypothetical protein